AVTLARRTGSEHPRTRRSRRRFLAHSGRIRPFWDASATSAASPCDRCSYWLRRAGTRKVTRPPTPAVGRFGRLACAPRLRARLPLLQCCDAASGSALCRRNRICDREQLRVVLEQLDHFPVERWLAIRRLQDGFPGVQDRVAPPPGRAGSASSPR